LAVLAAVFRGADFLAGDLLAVRLLDFFLGAAWFEARAVGLRRTAVTRLLMIASSERERLGRDLRAMLPIVVATAASTTRHR